MKGCAAVVLMAVLLVVQAPLLGNEGNVLTLSDCIQIALKNNSQLRIAEHNVDASVTDQVTARSYMLPNISLSLGSGRYIQGERLVSMDVPVDYDLQTGQVIYEQRQIVQKSTERNSHSASASLSQNIFDFGRSIYGIKQANALNDAAEHSLVSTRQVVMLNVYVNYYRLLEEIKLQGVYEEALKVGEDQVKRVESMVEVGSASKAEWYQARVTLGSNMTNLINQKNMVSMARAQLNNALGRDPNSPIEIEEELGQAIQPDYGFEAAVETALQNSPQIKSAMAELRASNFSVKFAQGRYLPSIGASVRYNRSNDDIARVYTSELNRDFSVTLGVGLDLNIFNGFADHAAVQRASLNAQVAQERLAESRRILIANVKNYFLALKALKDIIEINKENLEAATENLRLQQERRRVGAGTELEVSQAQVALTEAQSTLVRAEYQSKRVKAQLESEIGILSE